MLHGVKKWVVVSAAAAAFALAAIAAVAPPAPPSAMAEQHAYAAAHAQTLSVSDDVSDAAVTRDHYTASPGIQTLSLSATNYDWAKLVLLDGNWPITTGNVTVMLRWMRQENGPPNWWNRNNPLNNGLGSGGGGGTGSYDNLVIAAKKVAENLHRPLFATISSALAKSESTKSVEKAIWASPWSTSHYMNGTHWSDAPVPTIKAPDSAWG
jgi:hypothetical protein